MNTLTRENREADRGQAEQFITPPASVTEIADGYMLEIEMPGVKKERWFIANRVRKISGARSSRIHQSMATKSAQKSTRPW